MTSSRQPARRGTLLVVVLGLITIFLALMLAITVRVYNSTKNSTTLQQTVQAYLMMVGAKKVIAASGPDCTAGDETGMFASCGRPFVGALGWFHIKASGGMILAVGGSSAVDGPKTSVVSGDPQRNAYEVRLYYAVSGAAPNLVTSLQPVADNSTYW